MKNFILIKSRNLLASGSKFIIYKKINYLICAVPTSLEQKSTEGHSESKIEKAVLFLKASFFQNPKIQSSYLAKKVLIWFIPIQSIIVSASPFLFLIFPKKVILISFFFLLIFHISIYEIKNMNLIILILYPLNFML